MYITGKRYCLHGTVILGFLSRVIDCYGIPGSRLYGTVLAEVVPLASTADRLTGDYGTVYTYYYTVQLDSRVHVLRKKPRLLPVPNRSISILHSLH